MEQGISAQWDYSVKEKPDYTAIFELQLFVEEPEEGVKWLTDRLIIVEADLQITYTDCEESWLERGFWWATVKDEE